MLLFAVNFKLNNHWIFGTRFIFVFFFSLKKLIFNQIFFPILKQSYVYKLKHVDAFRRRATRSNANSRIGKDLCSLNSICNPVALLGFAPFFFRTSTTILGARAAETLVTIDTEI